MDEHSAGAPHENHHGSPATATHEAHLHAVAHAGHRAHAKHESHGQTATHGHGGHGDHVSQFRRLFWIMLLLAVPVVVFSPMFAMLLGYALPDVPGIGWVSPVLGTVVFL